MDEEMRRKLTVVQRWLEDVFAGEAVPAYEINSHTVDILYNMASQSERKTSAAQITLQQLEQQIREYSAETDRLKSVSEWLGLALTDLSPEVKGHLQNLAATSLALGLGDCSDTSLCLSLSELVEQRAKDEVLRKELERERQALQQDLRQSLVKQVNQRRVLSEVGKELDTQQTSVVAKQAREVEFLKQKTTQYHKLVSNMKGELNLLGYKPDISHSSLLEISKEVEELQTQLSPLKSKLASYQDLPPDLDLAKVKVHEARCRLTRLEEEFSRTVDLVHTEK